MRNKPGLIFLALAGALLVIASRADLLEFRLGALWSALDFGLLSAAYWGIGPRLLLKRPDGQQRPWAWIVYGPYFLLNHFSFAAFRLGERSSPFVEILPNLILGRRLTAREAIQVPCSAVLDLAAEFAEVSAFRHLSTYRSLPVLDTEVPTPDELIEAVSWLIERVAQGPVYVHCALGHGRSASVVIAYLIATGRAATVAEGLAHVRSLRPGVDSSVRQFAALEQFCAAAKRKREQTG